MTDAEAADAGAAGTAPQFTHSQIMRVLSGILLCILLGALDQTVVIPAVPAMAADLKGFNHLSWIVTAYLLTSIAATPIYGKLSDIYGRRALLMPALGLFMAASCLCAMAGSLPQLILFRLIQGLGGAGLMSMAQAAIADVIAPRERGRYQGYMASAWGVACIAGPIVGGWMTDHVSWRAVFWINVPLGGVAMWLCWRGLAEMRVERRPARIDLVGAGLLMAGVTALLVMLGWGGTQFPWLSFPVLGLALAGFALLGILAWHQRRITDPLLPPRLFADPVFRGGVMVAFFASLALFGGVFLLPLLFQLVRGADASASGLLVIPFMAGNVGGAFTGGQIARYLGRTKAVIASGLTGASLGFVLLAFVGAATPTWFIVAAMLVLGFPLGMTLPTVLVAVQNAAERRDVGVATGTLLFLRAMGGAFGSALVGALLSINVHHALRHAGIDRPFDLGTLRGGAHAAGSLDPVAMIAAESGLRHGFHAAFGVCAALMLVSVVIALRQRDVILRSVLTPEPAVGH